MFSYVIIETNRGPLAQILHEENVIDECGPWDDLGACITWADGYVQAKNNGLQEPDIQ